ncbi:MAG: hypothetical protein JRJ00_06155 [Deltaproteobacteria bacterium]|nr:hypothetical protein [Deltaproteobacteria bacterium]
MAAGKSIIFTIICGVIGLIIVNHSFIVSDMFKLGADGILYVFLTGAIVLVVSVLGNIIYYIKSAWNSERKIISTVKTVGMLILLSLIMLCTVGVPILVP